MKNWIRTLALVAAMAPAAVPAQGASQPLGQALAGMQLFEINADNWAEAGAIIDKAGLAKNALVVIHKGAPQGPLPVRPSPHLRILDHRYQDGINLVRGHHPRLEGIWTQYSHLSTGLRQNMVISDVIMPDVQVYDWRSQPKEAYSPLTFANPDEYAHNHNHYQNFLSEVWNFNPYVNGVAIWGDSGAFVPGSKAWGAFFSARSWPLHWQEYVPGNRPHFEKADFDAQLVGVEIDVLNSGKPWYSWEGKDNGKSLAKTGVQIVGFGQPNTQAIEIRSQDSDSPDWQNRKGVWKAGMVVYNALSPDDGRVIFGLFEHAGIGIDFDMPLFSKGALRFRTEGKGQGIVVNGGQGGEIYADGASNALVLSGGKGGFRLVTADGKEAMSVAPDGSVSFGKRHVDEVLLGQTLHTQPWRLLLLIGALLVVMVPLQVVVTVVVLKRMRARDKAEMAAAG